jgi:hypothetical protein
MTISMADARAELCGHTYRGQNSQPLALLENMIANASETFGDVLVSNLLEPFRGGGEVGRPLEVEGPNVGRREQGRWHGW